MLTELVQVPLFSELGEEELTAIANMATTRSLPANSVVVNEGDQTNSLYIINSGKVKIYLADENGKEVMLGISGPGEYFGEMVLDGGPRSASVMTLEASKFSIIQKEDLEKYLRSHPEVALSIIKHLINRVRALTDNVKSLALLDVYGRFRKLLLDLAVEENGKMVIKEKLTQKDMANRVGSSREMISRILRELTVGGYIEINQKKISILKTLPSGW